MQLHAHAVEVGLEDIDAVLEELQQVNVECQMVCLQQLASLPVFDVHAFQEDVAWQEVDADAVYRHLGLQLVLQQSGGIVQQAVLHHVGVEQDGCCDQKGDQQQG